MAEDDITVVIADDHGVVRGGLRLLLHNEEGISVIGEAEDVPGALRLVERRLPRGLVLDLNMPGPSGIHAPPDIKRRWPDTQVVVLTMQADPAYARASLQAGADAYVLKEAAERELVDAVRAVAAGGAYLHPAPGGNPPPPRRGPPPTPRAPAEPEAPDDLSERELEVLRMIALGHTNAEIG